MSFISHYKNYIIITVVAVAVGLLIFLLNDGRHLRRLINAQQRQIDDDRAQIKQQVDSLTLLIDVRLQAVKMMQAEFEAIHQADSIRFEKELRKLKKSQQNEISRIDSLNTLQLQQLLSNLAR